MQIGWLLYQARLIYVMTFAAVHVIKYPTHLLILGQGFCATCHQKEKGAVAGNTYKREQATLIDPVTIWHSQSPPRFRGCGLDGSGDSLWVPSAASPRLNHPVVWTDQGRLHGVSNLVILLRVLQSKRLGQLLQIR